MRFEGVVLMKKIAVLGATGSIGRQTLEVVDLLRDEIEVYALSAHSNIELLLEQVKKYQPQVLALSDPSGLPKLTAALSNWSGKILSGKDGLVKMVTDPEVNVVVSAAVGVAGLLPTHAAIKAGKQVALANKETLVAGGRLIMDEVRRHDQPLLPVDSEHSAVFQALLGQDPSGLG